MAITINGDGLIDIGGTTSSQGRVRLAEDADNGTNYVELTAPASVASNRVITFPDATTTVVGTDTTQTLTNKTLTSPTITGGTVSSATLTSPTLTSPTIDGTPVVDGSLVVLGTSQAATGNSVTFGSIPSWAKKITLMFHQVSTSGNSPIYIRLGTASGIESAAYANTSSVIGSAGAAGIGTITSAFNLTLGTSYTFIAAQYSGQLVFSSFGSDIWVVSGIVAAPSIPYNFVMSGSKPLSSGALTQIQITTFIGTEPFDNGSFNIQYE
jgi:hypothetical protein